MIASIGALGLALWWLALAVFFFAAVPVVLYLASRIILQLRLIRDYAGDILEHGVGLAGNLDPVPELGRTRELVGAAGGLLGRYRAAVARILGVG
jgi:hypothetical protein